MKQFTLISMLSLVFVIGLPVFAGPLSMKECYRAAINHNAQRKLQTERLSETNAKIDEISGQRLPTATVIGSITHNGDVQKLNFGMSTFSMTPDNSYRYMLQFNQTVFDGFRVSNTIEIQRQNLAKTEQDRLKLEHDIAFAASSAYWSWALTSRVEKVAYESMLSSRNNAELAQKRYDAGQISRFDVVRAEVQADQFATNWESAKANRSRSAQLLSHWTGFAIDESMVPADSFNYTSISGNFDSLLAIAKHTRSEFNQYERQKNIAELGIRLSKVGYYPMVFATGNLTWMNGSDPFNSSKLNRSWAVGAQLSYPLFDGWQTRAKVEESRSALKQTDWLIIDFERSVANELRIATIGLADAERRLQLQDKYIAQAKEAYRLAREQFDNGQLSARDVSDAELALSNARLSREQSLYEWTMAFVGIRKATGELRNDLQQEIHP